MRIAVFTDTFLPQVNGVVRSTVTLVNGLVGHGHEAAVFTMQVSKVYPRAVSFDDLDPRVRVHAFPSLQVPGFKDIQARIPTVVQPLKAARRFHPDVIHLQTIFTMGWEAVCIARLLGCPLVGTHHGFLAEYLNNFGLDFGLARAVLKRYLAWYYNRCTAVVTPARALRDELLEYGLNRPAHVISNPVDLARFSLSEPKKDLQQRYGITRPTVVHMGRLVKQKSVDVLLHAFALLRGSGIEAHLLVLGDGRERAGLEALACRLGIGDDVVWGGMLHGLALIERLATGDVFVSASKTEVQPLVFLEAMALGIPTIGVRAGGVPECVRHRHNGLVVPPDDPAAFAEAMRALILDPALRREYGLRARDSARQFEAGPVVREMEGLYRSLTGSLPANAEERA
ncbi:MAG: glycosyltransferase [Gammaproteobacteria bacterium]